MRNFNESSLDDFVEVKEDLIPMEDVQDVKVDNGIQDCLDETNDRSHQGNDISRPEP